MIGLDVEDIICSSLIIFFSLLALMLSVFLVISFYYPTKTKNKSAKYQNYGFTIMSVNVFILELTYLIPYCLPRFTDHLNLCIAFGAVQYFVENISMFFVIGMSICLLLHILASFKKCQRCYRKNIGKIVFLSWVPAGFVYTLFFMIVGLSQGLFQVEGNRCWIIDSPWNMNYTLYEWLSYKCFVIGSVIVTIVCSIVCGIMFKIQAKMYKYAYQTAQILDKTGQKEMVNSLNKLNRMLLRRYIGLAVICFLQEGISDLCYFILAENVPPSQEGYYLMWEDLSYPISCFLYVAIFAKGFLSRLVYHIWDKIYKFYRSKTKNTNSTNTGNDLEQMMILGQDI